MKSRFLAIGAAMAAGFAISAAAAPGGMFWPLSPIVSVRATTPVASEPGNNPGRFTVTRTGNTNSALTVSFAFSGTASNGVDCTAIPALITLAPGQTSSNLMVTPVAEPSATGFKTVVLSLARPHLAEPEGRAAPNDFIPGFSSRAVVYIVYNYTNLPPTVRIVGPTNGSSYLSRPNITISAVADDTNGWVTSVEFFANGASLGLVTNNPFAIGPIEPLRLTEAHGALLPIWRWRQPDRYQILWTNAPPGDYALTAVASDSAGQQTTSTAVHIVVTSVLPTPEARIISPSDSAQFPAGTPINIFAAAGEPGGVIRTVEFLGNGEKLGMVTNLFLPPPLPYPNYFLVWRPYIWRWTNAPGGSNTLAVIATDANGSQATSAPVSVNVLTNFSRRHRGW